MKSNDRTMQPPRRQLLMTTGAMLLVGGCANTTIKEGPGTWPVVPMADSELVPANPDPSRRTRVVVLASDESPAAKGAGLAEVATAALETILGGGGVEVVDRRLANRLDQELKLAEMKGSGSYAGPEVADYAIRVVLGAASYESTFSQASTAKNLLTGKPTTVPAGYQTTARSAMTVRIYAVPSLRLVEQFSIDGRTLGVGEPQPAAATPAQAASLMRLATEDGIRSKKGQVLNEFSPKGYITERRARDKTSIFRVQIGKHTGAKTGNSVEIWTMQKVGATYDEVLVGKGVMSDVVGSDGSWILVDDEKVGARVRKYDFVKVKNGTVFDNLKNPLGSLIDKF